MKKILFFLMAVMAVFTSCSDDEVMESASKKIKFNFTFDKVDENGTRAIKSSWEAGDKVFIMFKNQYYGYLECTYDGSTWTTETKLDLNLSADEADKRLMGIWVEGNQEPKEMIRNIQSNANYYSAYIFWDGTLDFLSSDLANYTFDAKSNTITANLTFAMKYTYATKITVTGLDDSKNWTLASPSLAKADGLQFIVSNMYLDLMAWLQGSDSDYFVNKPITGLKADDGLYFLGNVYDESKESDASFTLVNTTDNLTYKKTFTGKALSLTKAFKFAGPTADNLNGWEVQK